MKIDHGKQNKLRYGHGTKFGPPTANENVKNSFF